MRVVLIVESEDRGLLEDVFAFLGVELRRFFPAANIELKYFWRD